MADDDPFLWLEEVEGEAALAWVRAQNARSSPRSKAIRGIDGALPRRAGGGHRRRPHPLSALSRRPPRQFLAGRDACRAGCGARRASPRSRPPSRNGGPARHRRAVRRRGAQLGVPGRASRCRRNIAAASSACRMAARTPPRLREFDIEAARIRRGRVFPARGQAERRLARRRHADRRARLGAGHDDRVRLSVRPEAAAPRRAARRAPTKCSAAAPRMSASAPASCATRTGRCAASSINRQLNFFESERFLLAPQGPVRLPVPARSSFRGFVAGQLVFSLEEDWRRASRRRAGLARSRRLPGGCRRRGAGVDRGAGAARVDRGCRDDPHAGCWRRSTATCSGSAVAYRFEAGRWIARAAAAARSTPRCTRRRAATATTAPLSTSPAI